MLITVQTQGFIRKVHLVVRMFQVDHRDDPLPELFVQPVLREGQWMAVMLRVGIRVAVDHHGPLLSGHLLGDDEAGGGQIRVTRLVAALVNELP